MNKALRGFTCVALAVCLAISVSLLCEWLNFAITQCNSAIKALSIGTDEEAEVCIDLRGTCCVERKKIDGDGLGLCA